MTAPMQITASTTPETASARAPNGISNDPGTGTSTTSSAATPRVFSPRATPSASRSTIGAFQRARTTPTRRPAPSSPSGVPARAVPSATHASRVALDATTASEHIVEALEQVAHPLALGDPEAEPLEAAALRRVVGERPHCGDAEVDQDLGADAVLAAVDRHAERDVGVDGVVALLLQGVGLELVADADAAALVAPQVDDDAEALLGDAPHRLGELGPAVAAQRAEHVAGQALAVHPHENVVLALHGPAHERQVLLAVDDRLVGVAGEVAPLGGDAGLGHPLDQLLGLAPVADEVGDRDEQEPVLLGEALELGHAGHVVLGLVDQLAQDAGRVEPGHARQVHRRLGVPRPLEHAALAGLEREDVAGAQQVGRAGRRVDQRLDGRGPVVGGDARRRAVPVVDAHGEGRAHALGVVGDHERQVELACALGADGRADDAGGVVQEEGDGLGRGGLGRHDEVALVLAVLVVDDDHDLTAADGGDGVLDLGEGHQLSFDGAAGAASAFQVSRRSTYLTVTSTSRLTRSPGPFRPRVVTAAVCGISATVKPSSSTSTTVRLTPSTVIEPFSTT